MIRHTLSILSIILVLLTGCSSIHTNTPPLYLLIGTYTSGNGSEGIYAYAFNEKTHALTPVSHTEKVSNPSYLAITDDRKQVYAVNENTTDSTPGMVSSFDFNIDNGSMKLLNTVPSNGSAPCYIAISKDQKNIAVANYNGGNFSIYKIDASGKLWPAAQIIAHEGTSANPKIQTQSHVHSTVFSPDGHFLFVCDLGNDTLYQYPFSGHVLRPVSDDHIRKYKIAAGFGPRHLLFAPDEKYAYLINELDAKINAYSFRNDTLKYLQTVTSTEIKDTATGDMGSAAIRIAPNGKFLYASNRGKANDIAIFSIQKDGTLQSVGHQPTDRRPRDFNIDPSGKYLIVASQDDNTVKVYQIDPQTGLLTYTGTSVTVPTPVALLFVSKKER